jgi:phenylpyruvate tautomerase PptA (4-oxalocrotonate tautomerase family)
MPYLRLSSLPLDEQTKRHLADELTATVLDILAGEKPEWTSVHFTPFEPDDFAIGGRLVSDGAIPDTHLELSAPGVDEKRWFALRNRLTDVLIEALAIPDSERWHVNVKLNRYDPHSFAVAGNAADEISGHGLAEDAPEAPEDSSFASARSGRNRGRGSLRTRGLVVGALVGAVFAYRWLSQRVGTDATVDAADPLVGEGVAAGDPDGRYVPDASTVREY